MIHSTSITATENMDQKDCESVMITTGLSTSLDSISDRNKIHFTILKLTGVIVLMSITITSLCISTNTHHVNTSDCIKIETRFNSTSSSNCEKIEPPTRFNSTLCTYLKQYPLPHGSYVSICRYQNQVRIDLRKFINGKPTIKGIVFNVSQWNYLHTLWEHVNTAISEASRF